MESGKLWAIILATGEGTDRGAGTGDHAGEPPPAAYRSGSTGGSPLERALRSATVLTAGERTLLVVSEQHRRWWQRHADRLPSDNTIVQPCDRGTACSVLLPVLHVLPRDPDALLLITRADHHVRLEGVLRNAIERAVEHVRAEPDSMVLLGLEPEGADDPGCGWISPGPGTPDGVREVVSIGGGAGRERAAELVGSGALWNSFTFIIRAALLEALFESTLPWLPLAFGYAVSAGGSQGERILDRVYSRLPILDFSDIILRGSTEELRVLPIGRRIRRGSRRR
jgi:mannose-1-phosphate guanylyltransferase